jgi:homocysteine S-methyltransferase
MNREQFRQRLQTGPLLLDGAMGTMLHSRGHNLDQSFDALNLTRQALIADIHRSYITAGADIIETNSFGANRNRLAPYQLEDQVAAVNRAAAHIARQVVAGSFRPVLVAGSMGPLGVRLAPLGRVSEAEAEAAFHEQALALAEGGVDLFVLETLSDLYEVRAAVKAIRRVSADRPIIALLTFTRDDRTLLGNTASESATLLADLDIDAFGVNCSGGPAQVLRLLATMHHAVPGKPLVAVPNAGWPQQEGGGRVFYPATPAYFGDYARTFVQAGAAIVGGCCGTTEAHIAAMRSALDTPGKSPIPVPVIVSGTEEEGAVSADPPTALATTLQQGGLVITVEMRPPKGISPAKMLAGAEMLKQAGATFLNVADIPLARMRMSAWAAATLIQRQVGLETILHFPTRGRNLLRVQADLLAGHALDVRNLFVTMGDPARIGDYPDAMDSYDIVPTGLIQLITRQMNSGRDKAGALLDQPTNFTVGCALSLEPREFEAEARLLHKKVQSGAHFALTQPVFDPQRAQAFLDFYAEQHGPLTLPLIIGIQPLYNSRNAEFLHNEVPGITIPESYRERMAAAADPQAEGVQIAGEIVAGVRGFARGIYIVPAFGRYDLAADVIDRVRAVIGEHSAV